ncbi:MAG TPA: RluA family pseudouridine synthase [Myxococcota bacterium]|nr:RluA family pseudouridine synthase [Myxococcota bacterium]HQK51457.1 RluA family pseudouridine synthase [Myxococcota bacterium]
MTPESPSVHRIEVEATQAGERLDVLIAARLPFLSRSAAQRLIEQQRVLVDGRRRPRGFRVPAGATIEVEVPPEPDRPPLEPQAGDLDILYEDEEVLALAKRPGVVVHPGAGHRSGTLVNRLLASGRSFSTLGGEDRPGLVHRLDKDTSGVLLLAKTDRAHLALSRQFQDRTIRKTYLALVLGAATPDHQVIRSAFGRRPGDRKQFTGRVREGREAVTEVRTVIRGGLCALVMAHPKTGRTHQIRVHLAEAGHPVVGDRVYGRGWPRPGSRPEEEVEALRRMERQALHAWSLQFRHPADGSLRTVTAPVPRDLEETLDRVFGTRWRSALESWTGPASGT